MNYEIYIDTLFVLYFGMNVLLLELTNCILRYTAAWKNIFAGALCGSLAAVAPFLLPYRFFLTEMLGFGCSILCMSLLAFRITSLKAFLQVLESLSVLTILLGAVLMYVLNRLPDVKELPLVMWIPGQGIGFMLVRRVVETGAGRSSACKVTLKTDKTKIKINALIDTGNSLVEPISGMPAAVLDKAVFDNLFSEEKPGGFRVIPYRTIDRKTGILPGYLIPEICVEQKGISQVFRNIYVGVQQEMTMENEYRMIINPKMLKGKKTERKGKTE